MTCSTTTRTERVGKVFSVFVFCFLKKVITKKVWDENMIEGKVIEMVSPVDEVGYYAAKGFQVLCSCLCLLLTHFFFSFVSAFSDQQP